MHGRFSIIGGTCPGCPPTSTPMHIERALYRGVHPPETMMHFPLLFQISPLFSRNFRTLIKIFAILLFPDKFLDFPPIFPVSIHFPSVSRKLFFPPTLTNFPLCFTQIHLLFRSFYIVYVYFVSPHTLTMTHLCITQCTYWTPLHSNTVYCC